MKGVVRVAGFEGGEWVGRVVTREANESFTGMDRPYYWDELLNESAVGLVLFDEHDQPLVYLEFATDYGQTRLRELIPDRENGRLWNQWSPLVLAFVIRHLWLLSEGANDLGIESCFASDVRYELSIPAVALEGDWENPEVSRWWFDLWLNDEETFLERFSDRLDHHGLFGTRGHLDRIEGHDGVYGGVQGSLWGSYMDGEFMLTVRVVHEEKRLEFQIALHGDEKGSGPTLWAALHASGAYMLPSEAGGWLEENVPEVCISGLPGDETHRMLGEPLPCIWEYPRFVEYVRSIDLLETP